MKTLFDLMAAFMSDRSGTTATEYALIAVLVSVAIIAAVTGLGSSVSNLFTTSANALD